MQTVFKRNGGKRGTSGSWARCVGSSDALTSMERLHAKPRIDSSLSLWKLKLSGLNFRTLNQG